MVEKKYLIPFILVTSLFFLWGFANDITNPMVSAFKKILELNNTQASWVQAAFYGGYFTMALPAAIFIKKFSYKKGILLGLALYATGALLFYPAAAYEEFGFFLAALYILTFGLAFLETTANPYVLSMGEEETATQRLNLAQAFNPIGALSGLFVAQTFILGALQSDDLDANGNSVYETLSETAKAAVKTADLEVVRNPYVALGGVVLFMLLLFVLVKMPDTKDDEVHAVSLGQSLRRLFSNSKVVEGIVAQMFYVGAQIMCWTYIYQYAEPLGIDNQAAVKYAMSALGVFLVGRWICTFLLRYVASGKLLLLFSVFAMIFTLGAIFLPGMTGLYSLILVSFCMSLMFPTIYGITLKGLGEDAKFASAFLVMAIVGGAFMPILQGMILDIGGSGYTDVSIMGVPEVKFSFFLPMICFVVVGIFAFRSHKRSQVQ